VTGELMFREGGIGMLVLGIDPGLAMTGFGLVEESDRKLVLKGVGCIRTPATLPVA